MPTTIRVPEIARNRASRLLGLCFLLPIMGCAAPEPQIAAPQPQLTAAPIYTGIIAAIRPETSSQDETGSIRQIMMILGQPVPPPASGTSEIVLRLADNTVKTSVQPSSTSLAVGSRALVTAASAVTVQPY